MASMASMVAKTLVLALSSLAVAGCVPPGTDQARTGDQTSSVDRAPATPPAASLRESAATPAAPGPFAAGFRYLVLEDPSRTDDRGGVRSIPVHLWYPVDASAVGPGTPEAVYPLDPIYAPGNTATSTELEAFGIDRAWDATPSGQGPFPLLLLSPGWSQDPTFYAYYGARFASHGFVVAGLTHAGDGDFMTGSGVHPAKVIHDRPRDLSFALSRLLDQLGSGKGRRHGLVDRNAVAAMGHSIGGYAALAVAGGDDDSCDAINEALGDTYAGPWCQGFMADPRFRAVILLDASDWALRWHELARVEVPIITLNTDTDSFAAFCPGANARSHAAHASDVNLRVDVIHSNHQSFTRWCDEVPLLQSKGIIDAATSDFLTSMFCSDPDPANGGFPRVDPHLVSEVTSELAVAFLKTHLAHEPGYRRYLTPRWAWNNRQQVGLFTTEEGGESHFGPNSPCLPPGSAGDQFDYYWRMLAPGGDDHGRHPR